MIVYFKVLYALEPKHLILPVKSVEVPSKGRFRGKITFDARDVEMILRISDALIIKASPIISTLIL